MKSLFFTFLLAPSLGLAIFGGKEIESRKSQIEKVTVALQMK